MEQKTNQKQLLVIGIIVLTIIGFFITSLLIPKKSDQLEKTPDYYKIFSKYKKSNKKFENGSIKKVSFKDLKIGKGKKITKDMPYKTYYIGWIADGKVFDSSFAGKELKPALAVEPGSKNLVQGWREAIKGMKIGGIREISIPAAKAYGDQQVGPIPANSDLKFVIMAIE